MPALHIYIIAMCNILILFQVLEMARDCLHKSESKQVTSSYFYDMADSLDRLLAEVNKNKPEYPTTFGNVDIIYKIIPYLTFRRLSIKV